MLFAAPLADVAPTGPGLLFGDAMVTEFMAVLRRIRETSEVG